MTLLFCISQYSNPTLEASKHTTSQSIPSGKANTRAEVTLSFNSWKLLTQALDHMNLDLFQSEAIEGDSIEENPSTNLL